MLAVESVVGVPYWNLRNRAVSTSLSSLIVERHSVISLPQTLLISDAEADSILSVNPVYVRVCRCVVTEIPIIQSYKRLIAF